MNELFSTERDFREYSLLGRAVPSTRTNLVPRALRVARRMTVGSFSRGGPWGGGALDRFRHSLRKQAENRLFLQASSDSEALGKLRAVK